jgi:hypothetical protein
LSRAAAETYLKDVEGRIDMWMMSNARKHFPARTPATHLIVAVRYDQLYALMPEELRQEHRAAQDRVKANCENAAANTSGGNPGQPSAAAPSGGADDPSAYVLVSCLWPQRPAEFRRASDVTKYLDKVPNEPFPDGIRNRRKGHRRYVHAGDWHRHFAEKDRKASDAWDTEAVPDYMAEVEARKDVERARNRGK